MVNLRSGSNSGLVPVVPSKSTTKARKVKSVTKKVAKATKVNNISQLVSNTPGDTDVSTAPLPPLPSLSGFGSLTEDSYPLIGYGPRPRGCLSV